MASNKNYLYYSTHETLARGGKSTLTGTEQTSWAGLAFTVKKKTATFDSSP
jgi:hypothetical protein